MRNPLLALAGLVVVLIVAGSTAQSYFRQPPTPAPAAPHYVNGNLTISNSNLPSDQKQDEKSARAAHQAALARVFAAFDLSWASMCAPEQRIALVGALNDYFGDRLRFDRRGGLLSPDYYWKGTAFDWQTVDDKHVERLTRVSFSNGYFVMKELDSRVADAVREIVKSLPSPQRCDATFDPWSARGVEGYLQADRESARANALAELKAPWPQSCDRPAHRRVVREINQYYRERVAQQNRLLSEWGVLGLRRGSALWSTETDRTIDDLVRKTLHEGYLSLDDIHKDARSLVASLFDGLVGAARCPEQSAKVN